MKCDISKVFNDEEIEYLKGFRVQKNDELSLKKLNELLHDIDDQVKGIRNCRTKVAKECVRISTAEAEKRY